MELSSGSEGEEDNNEDQEGGETTNEQHGDGIRNAQEPMVSSAQ